MNEKEDCSHNDYNDLLDRAAKQNACIKLAMDVVYKVHEGDDKLAIKKLDQLIDLLHEGFEKLPFPDGNYYIEEALRRSDDILQGLDMSKSPAPTPSDCPASASPDPTVDLDLDLRVLDEFGIEEARNTIRGGGESPPLPPSGPSPVSPSSATANPDPEQAPEVTPLPAPELTPKATRQQISVNIEFKAELRNEMTLQSIDHCSGVGTFLIRRFHLFEAMSKARCAVSRGNLPLLELETVLHNFRLVMRANKRVSGAMDSKCFRINLDGSPLQMKLSCEETLDALAQAEKSILNRANGALKAGINAGKIPKGTSLDCVRTEKHGLNMIAGLSDGVICCRVMMRVTMSQLFPSTRTTGHNVIAELCGGKDCMSEWSAADFWEQLLVPQFRDLDTEPSPTATKAMRQFRKRITYHSYADIWEEEARRRVGESSPAQAPGSGYYNRKGKDGGVDSEATDRRKRSFRITSLTTIGKHAGQVLRSMSVPGVPHDFDMCLTRCSSLDLERMNFLEETAFHEGRKTAAQVGAAVKTILNVSKAAEKEFSNQYCAADLADPECGAIAKAFEYFVDDDSGDYEESDEEDSEEEETGDHFDEDMSSQVGR